MVFKWCSRQFGGERPLGATSPKRASAPELSTAPFEHQGVRPPRKGAPPRAPLGGARGTSWFPVDPGRAFCGPRWRTHVPNRHRKTAFRQRFGSIPAAFPRRRCPHAAQRNGAATFARECCRNPAETLCLVALGDVGAPARAAEGSTGVDWDPTCPPSAPIGAHGGAPFRGGRPPLAHPRPQSPPKDSVSAAFRQHSRSVSPPTLPTRCAAQRCSNVCAGMLPKPCRNAVFGGVGGRGCASAGRRRLYRGRLGSHLSPERPPLGPMGVHLFEGVAHLGVQMVQSTVRGRKTARGD